MAETQVLIVGAGPTGLVLAIQLARRGVAFRIIEKNPGPGLASRAMALQARTLEFYRQLGFADEVVARGIQIQRVHLRRGNHETAVLELNNIGAGLSPFPFALSFPQDEHERFLVEKLRELGVEVEWNTELLEFADCGDHLHTVIRRDDVDHAVRVQYLCGCDGARSTVRHGLDLDFEGGTYEQFFYVADVEATGPAANGDLNLCLSTDAFCAVFPIRTSGMFRLIGIVPPELADREPLTFEDIKPHAEEIVGVQVGKVNWFSTYHVHHRVAERFTVGRVLIAGDAGHIHSPAGGQGMNTGIGDATNLGWKLANVLQGRADAALLDSYNDERLAFAHLLIESTDRAFQVMVGKDLRSTFLRDFAIPDLGPLALRFQGARRQMFRLVSQIRVNYHESPLSTGHAGHVKAGDRLPWVHYESGDNFEPLTSLDWQVHVYGVVHHHVRELAEIHGIAVCELAWCENAAHSGLQEDALYLIRPDGYVAFAQSDQEAPDFREYLEKWGLRS